MPSRPDPLPLHVHRASADVLDTVVELLHDAYDWLITQGITDQWAEPFPRESVEQLIERGEVYVVSRAGEVIATFTLTYHADPELWDDPPDDAGYIRRLVVDRAHAGHNIGGQLLDHAGDLAAATGRQWLRLDCAKNNTRLHDYYRTHGFEHLGTIDLPHRQSGALFQRLARVPAHPAAHATDRDRASSR
jgi:ribosomal protein S18 acetylase RimI-like enzyme